MSKEGKIIGLISIVTIAIIGLGIYFLTRPPKETANTEASSQVDQSILVRENSNIRKASSEKAVLVEFGDFECPACAAYYSLTERLLEEHGNELTFVFRNFPLGQHRNARPAAYAAEAAGLQGKYWEMFRKIYEGQNEWSGSSNAYEIFEGYAGELELDLGKFKSDYSDSDIKLKVDTGYTDGTVLGVNSTPTFFLNGEKITLPGSYEALEALIVNAMENSSVKSESDEAYHTHFDFSLIINENPVDFSLDKYQSNKDNPLNEFIHFHDGVGKVVHIHKVGMTIGDLLTSLNFELTNDCITADADVKYCSISGNSLKLFVNGSENKDFASYVPQDLDMILLSYGDENEEVVQKQIASVTDEACIYSEKCPERGEPPTEECVGGLGTECEVEHD